MRVGSLVYATEQGLGRLAKSFYDAGVVTDVLVVKHSRHPTQRWYPGGVCDVRNYAAMERHVRHCDVMLYFETPFHWPLLRVRPSALMLMHECTPKRMPAQPAMLIAPSLVEKALYPDSVLVPVPVDVSWRHRTRCEVFVHNAGHGSFRDRNGTQKLLAALPYVRSPIQLVLRSQFPLACSDPRADVRIGTAPYGTLWDEGDAFVFAESFNGLSLPLQEARAAGMLVVASDRPSMSWLPKWPLVPIRGTRRARISSAYNEFDEAVVEPRDVAAAMDAAYGADIGSYSLQGREWARTMSWERWRPVYMELLHSLA